MYKTKEWLMLALLLSAFAISYMDRALLGVLAPYMANDLTLDPAQMGLVMGAFSIGYTLFALFAGVFADKLGPKRVVGVSMLVWSGFCALTGAVTSLWSLLVVRFLFGASEAPGSPAVTKMVAQWFPGNRYAGALGLVFTGPPIGAAIAGPVAGLLYVAVGWRMAFVIVGCIGAAWLVAWMALARDRPDDSGQPAPIVPAPLPDAVSSDARMGAVRAETLWWSIKRPAVIAAAIGDFALGYLLYFFLSWFPSYLINGLSMNHAEMSLSTIVPWVMGALGGVLGGYGSDYLVGRLGDDARARKYMIVAGLALAGCCVALAPRFSSSGAALGLMGGAVFFIFLTSPNFSALARTAVPDRHFGGTVGFLTFVTNAAGILAPVATGFMVKATGDFIAAFLLAGVVAVIGAAAVAILAPRAVARPGRPAIMI